MNPWRKRGSWALKDSGWSLLRRIMQIYARERRSKMWLRFNVSQKSKFACSRILRARQERERERERERKETFWNPGRRDNLIWPRLLACFVRQPPSWNRSKYPPGTGCESILQGRVVVRKTINYSSLAEDPYRGNVPKEQMGTKTRLLRSFSFFLSFFPFTFLRTS